MKIKIGDKFNRWTVLTKSENSRYFKCKCDCGTIRDVRKDHLIKGGSKSCGCLTIDLRKDKTLKNIGKKFNNWTIIDRGDRIKGKRYYVCKCECGTVRQIPIQALKSGESKSCGCLKASFYTEENLKKYEKLIDKTKSNMYEGTYIPMLTAKTPSNNTSGYKGVSKRHNGKWVANITIKGKQKNLGTYEDIEDAVEARKKAEEEIYKPIIEEFKNKNV